MTDFKKEIANAIASATNLDKEELECYIEVPKNNENGDFSFPCFKLAKSLKQAPNIIAEEIKNKIIIDENLITKIDIVGGYLNFYINNKLIIKEVLKQIQDEEDFAKVITKNGKTVLIDYSHPNIAKPFHIGHLRSTVIGQALYNVYEYLGYNVKGLNYLGDYGTQFGKMIEGYKRWGNEYNFEDDPINKMTEIYVRINELCKQDESVLEECRNNFKKLEDGDEYSVELWKKFRNLSLKEFEKIYKILGGRFDSLDGEAFIAPKVPEVINILINSGKLKVSEGAKIIDLEEKNMPPCMIEKSNGSSTYAARDLAAILYRARTYDFDKCLYITSYEQDLHFKQIFEVAKLLGLEEKYTNGLEHVSFGMVLLPTGKMSTREGNVVKLENLLNDAMKKADEIIENKNPDLPNKKDVARKVGIGAIIFNDLSSSRIKDEVFDIDQMLNFQGETGPYIQYTYVRTKSILDKLDNIPQFEDIDIKYLDDKLSIQLIKMIYNFKETLNQVIEKSEPSILSRYLIEVSKVFSNFYNENKIISEEKNIQDARVYLTFAVGKILKIGTNLLGIQVPDKM